MANTIDWGQGAVNNTIDWGKGKTNNTINWGAIYDDTPTGETNITGSGGVTPFTNTYSMTFDGVDEYFNGSSVFSDLNGSNQITISMWVKPTTGGLSLIHLITNPRNTTANNGQFGLYLFKGSRIEFWMGGTTTNYIRGNINAITLDAWNHIAVYLDTTQASATDRGFIYVNGADVTTSKSLTLNYSMLTATGSLHIGEEQNGGYNPFYGSIDEVALWPTNQVSNASNIYNGGVTFDLSTLGTTPSHWYRMGDGDTWGGSSWTLTDNIGSYDLTSANMEEADRVTDVP